MKVTLIQHMGSDQMVADAARVSTDRDRDPDRPIAPLIKYLAKAGHESPFESCTATFMVEAPLFTAAQWMRHRTQSYNQLSLRYTAATSDSPAYLPPAHRPLINSGSKAHPVFDPDDKPTPEMHKLVTGYMREAYTHAMNTYNQLLDLGCAEEIARTVLPTGTMTRFYATANLRNWVAFVKERTAENAQWEIKQLALQVKEHLLELFPIAANALFATNTANTSEGATN